jgi:hypothetical protein
VIDRPTHVPTTFDVDHFIPNQVKSARRCVGQWGFGWCAGRYYSSTREAGGFVPDPGARIFDTEAAALAAFRNTD